MRTTVAIETHLLKKARQAAMASRQTLSSLVQDSLRSYLSCKGSNEVKGTQKFVTFRGKGLQAGVNLDDTASLLDRMEVR